MCSPYDRYILGKWALAEGLIYPMYQNAIETPPNERAEQYCVSLDYGTQNAFAALLWGKYGDVWYLTKEYYYSGRDNNAQKTDEEYANDLDEFTEINTHNSPLRVIIDPSAASFITLLRKRLVNGRHPYKVIPADNSVQDGIRETATALRTGLIKVSPDCKSWKKEIEGYAWDESAGEDRPIKINDHAMDAMRYFVKTMRISVPKTQYKTILGVM